MGGVKYFYKERTEGVARIDHGTCQICHPERSDCCLSSTGKVRRHSIATIDVAIQRHLLIAVAVSAI